MYFNGIDTIDILHGNELLNIKDIKRKIEASYNLPKGSFELIFDDIALSDKKKLTDYNIYLDSTIYLVVEQKYEKLLYKTYSQHFWISYKGHSWTTSQDDLTILGIKKYIREIIVKNEAIENMKIIFRGKILDDNLDIRKEGLCGKKLELIIINN